LCDALGIGSKPEAVSPPADALFAELAENFPASIADGAGLSAEDRILVWGEACEGFRRHAATIPGPDRSRMKRDLLAWLAKEVPTLAANAESLERAFNRKLAKIDTGGFAALADARPQKSGFRRLILCAGCWQKMLQASVQYGGSESLAWRRLNLDGKLCGECAGRHAFDVSSKKSYVPHSIRARVSSLVDAANPWVKSAAAGKLAGPYIRRDWADTAPGDWFVADDVTWNHQVLATNDGGETYLTRPECLYLADMRTGYPLAFLLIPGVPGRRASYNSRHIRHLMLQGHDAFGLPHCGFFFENGIWRSADARGESDRGSLSLVATQNSLKSLPDLVKIRHAQPRNPRSKPVEGEFRILQERMRTLPGFVGFNERAQKSDRMKALERRAMSNPEAARGDFLTLAAFRQELERQFSDFAKEPQLGSRLQGKSPAAAWSLAMQSKPLRRLDNGQRWILASLQKRVSVTAQGIILTLGGVRRCYANEELNAYIGREVWAFYNLEYPALLTVADEKLSHKFAVNEISCPATTARPHQMAQAESSKAGFNRLPKAIAGSILHPVVSVIMRDASASATERAIGQCQADGVEKHRKDVQRQRTAATADDRDDADRRRMIDQLWREKESQQVQL
jgi:hypothetical protein